MAKLLLFCFPFSLHFFTSLIIFTLWNSGKAQEATLFLQTKGRQRTRRGRGVFSNKAPKGLAWLQKSQLKLVTSRSVYLGKPNAPATPTIYLFALRLGFSSWGDTKGFSFLHSWIYKECFSEVQTTPSYKSLVILTTAFRSWSSLVYGHSLILVLSRRVFRWTLCLILPLLLVPLLSSISFFSERESPVMETVYWFSSLCCLSKPQIPQL